MISSTGNEAEPDSRPDLNPVRNRLQWALLHASRIDELIKSWAKDALVVDQEEQAEFARIIHRARVIADPPVDVALALSDALHQSRAALDNVVGVLRGGATATSSYVITRTALEFDTQGSSTIGVARQARPSDRVAVHALPTISYLWYRGALGTGTP